MKQKLLIIAFCFFLLPIITLGQISKFEGIVYDDEGNPVPNIQIKIEGAEITTTDAKGHFTSDFTNRTINKPGAAITISVESLTKEDWVVYDPIFGKHIIQDKDNKEQISIKIARKCPKDFLSSPLQKIRECSKVFLSSQMLSNLIAEQQTEANIYQSKITSEKNEEIAAREIQQLKEQTLRNYVLECGVPLDKLTRELEKWSRIRETDSDRDKSLKEYHNKNLIKAAELRWKVARDNTALDKAEDEALIEQKEKIEDYLFTGGVFFEVKDFRNALNAYKELESLFNTKFSKQKFIQEWLRMKNSIAMIKTVIVLNPEEKASIDFIEEALVNFQEVLKYYSKNDYPAQFVGVTQSIGILAFHLGLRTEGQKSIDYLNQALTNYQESLLVLNKKTSPALWAVGKMGIGESTLHLGLRTDGQKSIDYLNQALTIFQESLSVTKETIPLSIWASIKTGIGNSALNLGLRTEGQKSIDYLNQALANYQESLLVFTKKIALKDWIGINRCIFFVLLKLADDTEGQKKLDYLNQMVSINQEVSSFYEDKEMYLTATWILHDLLFQFDRAFSLNQKWLKNHNEDIEVEINFAENHFTTNRFSECDERIEALLIKEEVPVDAKMALRVIQIANLFAMKQFQKILAKIDLLIKEISNQPLDFKLNRGFDGTKYYINQNEKLKPHRGWLFELIDSLLPNKDRDSILESLKKVRVKFKE